MRSRETRSGCGATRRGALAAAMGIVGWPLLAGVAWADEPAFPRIYGGEAVEACAWPSAVSFDGGTCTGVLVDERVVLTAAHCLEGASPKVVEFGNDYRAPAREVGTDGCTAHPNYPELGFDIAYCTLDEAVTDVPLVPVLAGCEADAVTIGQVVTVVGFGVSDDELGDGPKRAVNTDVRDFDLTDVIVGGDCRDSCFGDSGGPVFIELEDGTWRVFGITSEGLQFQCGGGGVYTQIHEHLDWLESESGIDLTPCHDEAGDWDPGLDCVTAPTEPDQSFGAWPEGCAGGLVLARAEVCAANPGEITPNPETCFDDHGEDAGTEGGTNGPATTGSSRGDGDEGCACALTEPSQTPWKPLVWAALGLLALAGLRRRSPHERRPPA